MTKYVCRICLATNVRSFDILNTYLQTIYERLTDYKLNNPNGIQSVCYICHTRLKQCYNLIKQATLTEGLLMKVVQSVEIKESPTKLFKLSVSSLINISINPNEEKKDLEVKLEDSVETVKQEDWNQHDDDIDFPDLSERNDVEIKESVSDSEDDIPLKSISLQKHLDSKLNKSVKVKKKKKNRVTISETQEIILDKEQQILEFMERAKSINYLNSPYKCDLCYKGFVDPGAFTKHKEKHDERIGAHECGICHIRFPSLKQLHAHTGSVHSRRFVCNTCNHRSLTKNQAKEHENWHRGLTYPCKLCGTQFRKATTYLSHKRKCHSSQHECTKCGDSFVSRHGLLMHASKTHRLREENENPTEPASERYCHECRIQFDTCDALKRHVLTSNKHVLWNDSSQCTICGVPVPGTSRQQHMAKHARALKKTDEGMERAPAAITLPCTQQSDVLPFWGLSWNAPVLESHWHPIPSNGNTARLLHGRNSIGGGTAPDGLAQCPTATCDAQFTSRGRLRDHTRRVHYGYKYNKNVVCEICGKSCTSNATLRYHQRRHTGERPYPCTACPARFSSREHLRLHSRSHSGERPYSCALCGHAFSQKPALNRHYRVHTGAKPYECHLCSKSFSQTNSLKGHIRTVHLRLPPHKRKAKEKIGEDVPTEKVDV